MHKKTGLLLQGGRRFLSFFFFFNVDHFKSHYGIYYNIASVLCFVFSAMRHVGS